MYTFKNGKSQHIGANIQKSIKIDKETQEIIEKRKKGVVFLIRCAIWQRNI